MSPEIAERSLALADAGPVLETARLILRVPRAEDFDRYAEMQADPEASQYIGGVLSRPESWRKFLQSPGAWVVQGFAMFAVMEKASGRWLGNTGPWYPEGWPGTEVGWAFHRSAWGNGYAVEAATAAIDWSFDALGWEEVIHSIHPENVRSQALAQRLGSRKRGVGRLPAPFEDKPIEIWGQTRSEWFARDKA